MTVYNTGKVQIGSRYETPRFKSPTHPEIIRDADRIQSALLATRSSKPSAWSVISIFVLASLAALACFV